MGIPEPVLLVILIVAGTAILALAILKLVMIAAGRIERRIDRAVTGRLSAIYAPGEMLRSETMANFFGEQSRGPAQMRGNGGLVLLEDRLVFHMLVPDRTITIPLETCGRSRSSGRTWGRRSAGTCCTSDTPCPVARTRSPGSCGSRRHGGARSRNARPASPRRHREPRKRPAGATRRAREGGAGGARRAPRKKGNGPDRTATVPPTA